MEPSVLAPKKPKPPKWWALVTLAAGAAGVFGGMAVAGSGSYEIPPFTVELSAKPGAAGKTVFETKPSAVGVSPGFAEAGTHAGPLILKATVTNVSGVLVPSDQAAVATPQGFADFMAANGKAAVRAFAIKVGIVSLAGALALGLAISMGRWQRIVGSVIAGVLTLAVVGAITAATYDRSEFSKTQFRPTGQAPVTDPTDGLNLPGG